MKRCEKGIFISVLMVVLPFFSFAQSGIAGNIHGLQATLDQVYNTMITKCGELIDIGRGIAAFAATWYIAVRVWGHISRAEPVDLYPLFRPFVLGFAIINFPLVISMMNAVLQPTVTGTAALVKDSNKAIANLLQQKQDALKSSTDWQMYVGPSGSGSEEAWEALSGDASFGPFSGVTNWAKFEMAKFSYNLKNSIKVWLSAILELLFEAVALCINTVRTFYLIILAILGPLVFGLGVFDGMGHVIRAWMARYINIFLWLPVANIFGSLIGQIQEEMIKLDIAQIQANGQTSFGATDAAYLIFLIIGIIGYTTVPSITDHIIHAGHGLTLMQKTQSTAINTVSSATTIVKDGVTSVTKASNNFADGVFGSESAQGVTGAMGTKVYNSGSYLVNKLKGGD